MDVITVQEGESGRSMNVTTDLHPVLCVRIYIELYLYSTIRLHIMKSDRFVL